MSSGWQNYKLLFLFHHWEDRDVGVLILWTCTNLFEHDFPENFSLTLKRNVFAALSSSISPFRSRKQLPQSECQLIQAAGQRVREGHRASQFHARNRILPILSTETLQTVFGGESTVSPAINNYLLRTNFSRTTSDIANDHSQLSKKS